MEFFGVSINIYNNKNFIPIFPFRGTSGMSSTFEGIARGVPMLFLPVFCDQERNAHRAAVSGNGRVLPFKDVTTFALISEINAILDDADYAANALEAARLFHDTLVHPMDEAMYWIEYVIHSKGAKHLKSGALQLWWFQYLFLDILFVQYAWIYLFCKLVKYIKNKVSPPKAKSDEKPTISQIVAEKQRKKYPTWYKYCGLEFVLGVVAWCESLINKTKKLSRRVLGLVSKSRPAPQQVKEDKKKK